MAVVDQIIRSLLIIRKVKSKIPKRITLKVLQDFVINEMELRGINEGMSESTIKRDIRYINNQLGIKIAFDRGLSSYFIESKLNSLDIEEVLEPFDLLNTLNADSGLSEIIITDKYQTKGTEHLRQLIQAIRSLKIITFNYSKFGLIDGTERFLEPYAIKQIRGRWYIIGTDTNKLKLRTFGLDRISDLRVTTHSFKKDDNVDIEKKFEYSFGIYSSDEYPIEDVVLAFDSQDGSYLKSAPLHYSQQILIDNENEFIISLKIRLTEDFIMEILSRSWSLKVIAPQSLRDRVCEIYRAALDRY
jgi:predicted DNA-binding transcriptional regulator YafY